MYEKSTPPEPTTDFDDVGDFHQKFGLDNVTHYMAGPREVTSETLQFRLNFLLEELVEAVKAAGGHFEPEFLPPELWDSEVPELSGIQVIIPEDAKTDHVEFFDALIDLNYVSLGTAHFMGYPWAEGWALVQEANMTKRRAQSDASDSLRGSVLDVVKPEGWQPPDHAALLTMYGYDIPTDEFDPIHRMLAGETPDDEGQDTRHPMEPNR